MRAKLLDSRMKSSVTFPSSANDSESFCPIHRWRGFSDMASQEPRSPHNNNLMCVCSVWGPGALRRCRTPAQQSLNICHVHNPRGRAPPAAPPPPPQDQALHTKLAQAQIHNIHAAPRTCARARAPLLAAQRSVLSQNLGVSSSKCSVCLIDKMGMFDVLSTDRQLQQYGTVVHITWVELRTILGHEYCVCNRFPSCL